MKTYSVIGIMSGSSLDGVDLAYCEFSFGTKWNFNIIKAETAPYPEEWKLLLQELPKANAVKLAEQDIAYGVFLGNLVNSFIKKHRLTPDLISSHGHTIFHAPHKNYTFQLGNGQAISTTTGITTVADFRQKDILLGGQGAPLVPIGDELLFKGFDICLNIGGIANLSYNANGKRRAFDVCPANQLLNHLSLQLGQEFDFNGEMAALGKLNLPLFEKLNKDEFYRQAPPKSLSNQYVRENFIELLDRFEAPLEDKLYTCVKHIAYQMNQSIQGIGAKNILITGGGARNGFLTTAIQKETLLEVIIPSEDIIDFKEAMVFALMGLLRFQNKTNCLASATGASEDSAAGVVFLP
jgi:anhydro-N-acetylmuramic acid kinase